MDMKKMMGKEDMGPGDNMKKDAKLKALKELRTLMSSMMGDDVKNGMMKKVTVAAPDKEGLEQGLLKAKHMVDEGPMDEMADEADANEGEMQNEDMSPDELDAKIAELMAKKKEMMMK